MFDPSTGNPVDVPASQVRQALVDGTAGFGKDQEVVVQGPRGDLQKVPGIEAADLIAINGSAIGTDAAYEVQEARREEAVDYGGVLGGVGAAAAGAARGLSFGLSDLAGRELGFGDELAKVERNNPNLSIVSELFGAALPAIATYGGSAPESAAAMAVRGATTLGRGAEAVGGVAERLAVRGVTALGATEGGAAARILGSTARAGVEGSLYGVGQAVSESSLQDDPLTISKLLAGGGMGALMGAGLGAGLGGLGVATEAGLAKGGRVLESLTSEESRLGKIFASEVRPALDEIATNNALKAIGASEKAVAELSTAERSRIASRLLDDLPEQLETKSLVGAAKQNVKVAEVAEREASKAKEALDVTYERIDDALEGAKLERPDLRGAVETAREKVLHPLEAAGAKELNPIAGALGKAETAIADGKLSTLRAEASKLEAAASKASSQVERDALLGASKVLTTEAEKAAFTAAKAVNATSAAAELRFLHARESDYRWVSRVSTEGPGSTLGAVVKALKESSGGSGVGAGLGGAIAGPIGALVGAGLGGVGVASTVGRTILKQLMGRDAAAAAAVIARKATTGDVLRAITSTVDEMVDARVRRALGRSAVAARKATTAGVVDAEVRRPRKEDRSKPVQQRYEQKVKQISRFVASTGAAGKAATDRVRQGGHASVADAVDAQALAIAANVQARMPKPSPSARKVMQIGKQTAAPVSTSEMSSWLRYAEASIDPIVALDALADGKLAPEHVDALQDNYPPLLNEVRERITEGIANGGGSKMAYAEKVQLGLMLGIPTTELMVPENLSGIQEIYADNAPPDGASGTSAPGGGGRRKSSFDIDRAEDRQTRSERVEEA
jgi:hypothetical protein